jgi:hypothetical protein
VEYLSSFTPDPKERKAALFASMVHSMLVGDGFLEDLNYTNVDAGAYARALYKIYSDWGAGGGRSSVGWKILVMSINTWCLV